MLVGAAMAAASLTPVPTAIPVGVGTVPAIVPARPVGPAVDLFRIVEPPSRAPRPEPPAQPPVRLRLAALAVDAAVTPVDTDADGGLAIPDDPAVVGWWRSGAAPGSTAGTVVLVGHVDTARDGPGALFRLATLEPGDRVAVATGAGTREYAVTGVRDYPKAQLPAEVFDTAGAPRLVLVTCGGAFDRRTRHYADNVVAYAVPVDPS